MKFILCGFADLKSNWDENNIYLVISVYELVITTQFNFIWSNSQCSIVVCISGGGDDVCEK